ncbi:MULTISPECIES: DUF4435 domain-containing protein [unclassified Variovorax]|uniref:DUF4435 domain-containing protein n=1 Tax=unclassified Variovorax TaxID=663243 RepID=UPI0032E57F02
MTVDEIVSTLRHGSLSYLVVEGKTEMQLYRHLVAGVQAGALELQVCDGRDALLAIYKRRNEFARVRVIFVADQDLWIHQPSLKASYPDVIWTDGYCIENDILQAYPIAGKFLEADERAKLDAGLDVLIDWFAFEVNEFLNGRDAETRHAVPNVFDKKIEAMCEHFAARRGWVAPPPAVRAALRADPWRLIRGKQLVHLLARQLDKVGRVPRYGPAAIVDICIRSGTTPLGGLANQIRARLKPPSPTQAAA